MKRRLALLGALGLPATAHALRVESAPPIAAACGPDAEHAAAPDGTLCPRCGCALPRDRDANPR